MLQQQSYKSGVRWLVGSGVLALVSVGGWALYARVLPRSSEPIAVRLLTVDRDTVETTINESGTVELGGQQTLVSPAEGAVDRVFVQAGDQVRAGQTLLTLRNPDRQTALLDQQLQISQQEASLARNQQKIIEAQEQLQLDRQRLADLATGAEAGAISRSEVLEQETRTRTTAAAVRDAQSEVQTARLELDRLRLTRQRTERELQDTVVTAPLNGVVLGVRVRDGDGVELRTELLTLGNPAQQLVQLQLSTLNANQVRLNQLAHVSVIGPDPEVFNGRVQNISRQAIASSSESSSGFGSQQSEQATVATTVRLDRPTSALIPGGQVNVEIVLQQRQNVVAIGIEAVQRSEDKPFVWVVDEQNVAQRQFVTLGLESLTTVEVTSGLRAGDRVILPPPEGAIVPGLPVVPQTAPETP